MEQPLTIPGAREMGAVNWLGVWTLFEKEVRRFLKVWTQTILAPMATALVFLGVFAVAIGPTQPATGDLGFLTFMGPGLIMMTMVQNAFANTSSSLMIAKIQGNIVDILMPPLKPGELLAGLVGGGLVRSLTVGLLLSLIMLPISHFHVHDLGYLVLHAFGAGVILSLVGLLTAIVAEKFDHLAAITNFVVTPAALLSGTFYSIERLPEWLQLVCQLNPIFYLMDGFRYGLTGHADGYLWVGIIVVLGLAAVLWLAAHWMLRTGYKLKP
ncbi:MAG: ABC transporter permease [Alphaproteobacteria bacterium]